METLKWRKATRSGSNGGHCVEVAMVWRKAARSGSNGGTCVEVARDPAAKRIATRDSKNPDGPQLRFDTARWGDFLTAVKTGRYDL